MSANENANVRVTLNNEDAKRELEELQNEIKKLIELKKKAEAEGDVKAYKSIDANLKRATREAKKYETQLRDVDKVLSDINGASMNDLRAALRATEAQLNKMKRTDPGYAAKAAQAKLFKAEIDKVNGTMRVQQGIMGRLTSVAKGLLPAFGFAAIAYGFKRLIGQADTLFLKFEERVDNLSALTGLEGEQLDWLTKKAKETSVSTIEGNIRIKQSADSIIDAYTKVGSKRPELLKNKEALAAVTQEAIILSEAAKTELEPAVAGLTMALNQFDMEADESRRIINVLAAGSKVGAGDIPYLTEAMEKSGTTANLMKIPIEQWAGAVESVAPYYEQASMAGNSFDKVLLKMKEKQIGYVNGVFDMNTALDQLEKMYASGTSSADIFGVEHSKMGELLVKERGNLNEYTKAVTGSNVAIEQASKNTNNEAAKRAQAQNNINNLYLEFGEKIAPLLTKGITSGISLLNVAIKFRAILIPLTAAIAGYTVATKLAALWEARSNKEKLISITIGKLQALAYNAQFAAIALYNTAIALMTGRLKVAAIQFRAFSAALMANPIGLVAGAIVAAGAALYMLSKRTTEAEKLQRALNDVNIDAQKNIAAEKVEVEQLLKVSRNESLSKEARLKAIKKLNEIVPQYNNGLTLEKINTKEADDATKAYITSLLQKAKVQAAQEKLVEIEKELIDLQSGKGADATFWQQAWNAVISGGNGATMAANNAADAAKNYIDRTKELELQKEKLVEITATEIGLNKILSSGGGGGGDDEATKDLIRLKEQELELAKKMPAATEAEIAARNRKIESIQKEISRLNELGIAKENQSKLNELLSVPPEVQNEAFRKYFSELGEQSFEEFMAGFESEVEKWKGLGTLLEMPEEQPEADPSLDYAVKKYQESLEYKETLLNAQYEKGLIGEQEYQDELEKINAEKAQKKFEKNMEFSQKTVDIANMASNLVFSLMDMELEQAGENEEKKKEIRKKYADIGFVVTAAQIIANTAQGVMGMLADPSGVAGAILAVMVGATGLVQLGIANAQRQKVKALATGKYPAMDESGNVYDTTFAGRPKTGMYNGPQLGIFNEDPRHPEMVIDGITTTRLMVNRPDIIRAIYSIRDGRPTQFAEGKYPDRQNAGSSNPSTLQSLSPSSDPELKALIAENMRINQELHRQLKNGIRAHFKKYGSGDPDTLQGSLEDIDRFKSNINA